MKNGKNPTYEQRKIIQESGLNSFEWLVVKDTSTTMILTHRNGDKITKTITKELQKC